MSRSTNHPLVQTIIRALDRAAAFDKSHSDDHGAVRTTAAIIIDMGETCERFNLPHIERWESDAARAVCLAYALHCPDDELEILAGIAESEIGKFDDGFYEDEDMAVAS